MPSVSLPPAIHPRIAVLSRRRLLALAPAALLGSAAGLPAVTPSSAGKQALPPAVQARLADAMREAIAEARQAYYPFGAVLLDTTTGETVFRAYNATSSGDPSAHAEIAALRGAGLAGIDLTRTVLITSAESCPMCASGAVWAGVAGVAYGTSIPALVRFGYQQIEIRQQYVVDRSDFNTMPILGGVLSDETDLLYSGGPPA